MKFTRRSLFFQLITAVISMLVMLGLLIQGTSLAMYRGLIRDTVVKNTHQTLSHVKNNLDIFDKQLVYMISQVDLNSELRTYMADKPTDQFEYYQMRTKMNSYLSTFSALYDAYRIQMMILRKNDMLYFSTLMDVNTPPVTPEELRADSLYQKASQNSDRLQYDFYHENFFEPAPRSHTTLLVKSIYNVYTKRQIGTVYVNVAETAYYKLYQELISNTTRFVMLDSSGRIISDSVRENIGSFSPELREAARGLETGGERDATVTVGERRFLTVAEPLGFADGWLLELVDYDDIASRSNAVWPVLVGLMALFVLLTGVITFFLVNHLTRPISVLSRRMRNYMLGGDAERGVELHGCAEVEIAGAAYNEMLSSIDAYLEKLKAENSARRKAELYSLQMQINPHFLYNTLASIKYLTMYGRQEDASEACTALIALLRKALSDTGELIPLREELELTENYMRLQRLRCGDGISLICTAEESVKDCLVPKLILQPLIENAIFHAFKGKAPQGTIQIFAQETSEAELVVEILDNGIGMPPDVLEGWQSDPGKKRFGGIGIRNVHERIRMIYGEPYGLQIISGENVGTQITLRIPAVREQKEE